MNILYIILGLVFLILGGDWLLKGAVDLATKLKISKVVIGMTVVSFATSAPELIVSIKSALNGYSDLALGNVIGSNIANLALVLGVTLCLCKIEVEKSFYSLDWPVLMVASFLLYIFIAFDLVLNTYEGLILFTTLIIFLVYLLVKNSKKQNIDLEVEINENPTKSYIIVFFLLIGGLGLWAGSELLINGAVGLATKMGISERIIAVTVVSIGTSIPELAASIIAIIKKEKGISLGNLIGSNIFNILAVLGITAIITPIQVKDVNLVYHDIFWMLGIAIAVLPLCFMPKKMSFGPKEGIILLIAYGVFVYATI